MYRNVTRPTSYIKIHTTIVRLVSAWTVLVVAILLHVDKPTAPLPLLALLYTVSGTCHVILNLLKLSSTAAHVWIVHEHPCNMKVVA